MLGAGIIWYGARTVAVRDGRPLLDDGRVLDVANIVWCTGYRPAYGWIGSAHFGRGRLAGYRPRGGLRRTGPLFLGVPSLSGITSMLVLGAGRDAEMVVRQVARQVAARVDQPALREALTG
jgi:putative flavoprotein involved in K+ transport